MSWTDTYSLISQLNSIFYRDSAVRLLLARKLNECMEFRVSWRLPHLNTDYVAMIFEKFSFQFFLGGAVHVLLIIRTIERTITHIFLNFLNLAFDSI